MSDEERLTVYRQAFSRAVEVALDNVGMDNFKRCSWFGRSGDIHRQARGEKVPRYVPRKSSRP